MANGLLDLLGGLGTTPPSYMEGLLGQQATEDLRKRSIGTGLANALVGYLAMPKNQNLGLGRILAGTAQAGLQGAQGVYEGATADYMQQQKIAEMQRAKEQQDRQKVAIEQAATQFPQYADAIRANPELLKEIIAAKIKPAESPIAKLNPKDYTPESWAAFINSNNDTTQLREAVSPSTSDLTNERNAVAYANFNGKRFSELTPNEAKQVNNYIENSKVRVAGAAVPSQQPTFKDATSLRQEYQALPTIKAFNEVNTAYNQIKSSLSSPSPANDLAAATKFMKLLDPNSVVRESELIMAMNATGLVDRVANYANYVISGKKLNDNQRKDFADASAKLYNAALQSKNAIENQYTDIAKEGGLSPKLVVGSPTSSSALTDQEKARKLLEQRKANNNGN
jgi:hypothetical protein